MSENDEIDEEKIIETVKLLVETLKFIEFIFFHRVNLTLDSFECTVV